MTANERVECQVYQATSRNLYGYSVRIQVAAGGY